jgi:hypothetical protein
MRAQPEHIMGAPDDSEHEDHAESADEAEDNFGQWVALVVLLACWLAEAYM